MLKRLSTDADAGAYIDPTWRPHPSSTESTCPRCRGQGYLLRAYPNPGSSVPNYHAAPCPDCSPLV